LFIVAASFDHHEVEKEAQEKWAELGLYRANLSDESKPPYYLLVEFPYPSGDLHIGHWYAFAVTDIYARMLRVRGKNVLFPIGFDAFGLPAENAAIRRNLDPKKWTYDNMAAMRKQIASMGASFDWSKEVMTCEPDYYQWTQWLFVKLFEHGLAERRESPVKWCPKCLTVLANEQVIDGKCERCGTEVEEKRLTQWFLKITNYAERLLDGLEKLPWREEIKEAQRAWIGKSEGAKIKFMMKEPTMPQSMDIVSPYIEVFTTRPDTVFGATYLVLAPEHPFIEGCLTSLTNTEEVKKYVEATKKKTERERSENKEKTGVKLEGVGAINPATKEEIPIYVADYVLGSYGTGAVMSVPAHDERDYEFAEKFNLPVRTVIEPLFRKKSGDDAVRDGPFVMREAVACVVKHWKEDKYLILKWKNVSWAGFVTGGIDGADPVEAGKREILEETGYTHAKFIRDLGQVINVQFYHVNKKENRHARFHGLYFELEDDDCEAVSEEERAICDIHWVEKQKVESMLDVPDMKLVWNRVFNPPAAYEGDGLLANSGDFSGRENRVAMGDIVNYVGGELATQYRIRDWLVSRQRYWGCPIPIVYDPEGNPHAVPTEHLPWLLPTDVDITTPSGKAPLASSKELKERVGKLFGERWVPEYDTLDTFVDSSWYFLRYLDSKDPHAFSDVALMKKWLPINRYSGGSEHTTMHVLYARFFMQALYDLALVPVAEPFIERFNRGLIMGPDGQKMSKSKGNVVTPDEFVQKYGADAVRLYLAFIGPYNEPGSYPWKLDGVASMRKFLERVVRLVEKLGSPTSKSDLEVGLPQNTSIARASVKIAEDGDRFKFNTGVAALMTLMNEFETMPAIPHAMLKEFLIMLAPFAPHLAEHLWEKLGEEGSVHQQAWPAYDASLLVADEVEVVVQVAGRKRGSVRLPRDAGETEVTAAALIIPAVAAALAGAKPRRVVYIQNKIVNIVV